MAIRSANRGFTLIEVLLAAGGATILLVGIGTVMVMMFQGLKQSSDFFEATSRVDMVRQMTFDARTGESLVYPNTNYNPLTYNVQAVGGGSGYYLPEGGNHGHRTIFRAVEYNPTTETSSRVFITWESRRPTAQPWISPASVIRIIDQADALNQPVGNPVETFNQAGIELFHITRVSDRNFNVVMRSAQDEEKAHVELAVTLRNVR